jgi:PAS domain S-box-containing protein
MTTGPPSLDEMNARLAAVVAASSDAIISYATNATFLTWNPAAERMLGYTAEEMIGRPMGVIVPPERAHEPAEFFARLRTGETIRDLETVRVRKDGTRIPMRVNLAPIKDAHGVMTGVSATLCDLSERQRAEERFRSLLESAPDPILGVNGDGRIVFANAQTEKVFGYRRAEILGQPIELLVPERFREHHQRARADYHREPTTRAMGAGLDLSARRRDGSVLPVEISLSPMTDAGGPVIVAIVRDITERKRADAEVRERERKFRAIFNATFQFIGLMTPGGVVLEANQSALDLAGVTPADVIGTPFWETPWWTHSPELQARLREAVRRAARGEFVRFEATHRRPDGSLAAVDFSLKPVHDEAGRVILLVPEGRDVTDRKRAEVERERLLALAEAERATAERARETLERVQVVTDAALAHLPLDQLLHELLGRIRTVLAVDAAVVLLADETEPVLRVRAAEGVDEPLARTTHVAIGEGFAGRVAAAQRPVIIEEPRPADLISPVLRDGGFRTLLGVPLLVEGRLVGVLHVDSRSARRFTEDDVRLLELFAGRVAVAIDRGRLYEAERAARAEAEASLRIRAEAERMKDDLTNMVVHDLKNPVSGIAMLIQAALRRRDELPVRQRNTLLQIERTCREMMRLIQNVLEISKMEEGKMPVVREPVALGEIFEQVVREYTPVAEQTGKSLHVAASADLPAVSADHGLLKRVLVNLVVNGLRHSGSRDVRVEAAPVRGDGEVVIRVVDHGRGIPEEEQARIFEKFTSVRRGPGGDASTDTGLGLPFCKLAVERMGGRIALTSTLGAPTVFTVALPIHDGGR